MSGRWLLCFLLGCDQLVSEAELAALDLDGDGVPAKFDCDDDRAQVGADLWWIDLDGDGYGDPLRGGGCDELRGYADNFGDCRDDDPAINPETVWYPDADADGFPAQAGAFVQCLQPPGTLPTPREWDCDDDDPTRYPGIISYADGDGDGYGDPNSTIVSCLPTPGYLDNDADCDDSAAWRSPETVWYRDADADGAGVAEDTVQSCLAPAGYGALLPGDCDDASPLFSDTCPWVDVDVGSIVACGVHSDGLAQCWGDESIFDIQPTDPTDFVQVEVGGTHVCGRHDDGSIDCWGPTWSFAVYLAPAGGVWLDIDSGTTWSCGIRTSGALLCWGDLAYADLDTPPSAGPYTDVEMDATVACALDAAGGVSCWGDDSAGVVSGAPTETGLHSLSVGYDIACALRGDGAPVCWGDLAADAGPPTEGSFSRVEVSGNMGCGQGSDGALDCWNASWAVEQAAPEGQLADYSVGEDYGCAVTALGQIQCWGLSSAPIVPPTGGFSALALSSRGGWAVRDGALLGWGEVSDSPSFPAFAVAYDSYSGTRCLTFADGSASCSGTNQIGEANAPEIYDLVEIKVGALLGCGLSADGQITCWGYPDTIRDAVPVPDGDYIDLAVSESWGCGLERTGEVHCFGVDSPGEAFVPYGDCISIDANDSYACCVGADGIVSCVENGASGWATVDYNFGLELTGIELENEEICYQFQYSGSNAYYCNGASTEIDLIDGEFVDQSLTDGGYCFVPDDGTLNCVVWDDETLDTVPQSDAGTFAFGPYTSVGSSQFATCAVGEAGAIDCWESGVLPGLTDIDALPPGVVTEVAAGEDHVCVIADRHVRCAAGPMSALGQPVPDYGGPAMHGLSAGAHHSCAVEDRAGLPVCWGDDSMGQSSIPEPYASAAVVAVSAGRWHSCALLADGAAGCWGDDSAGQASPPDGAFTQLSAGGAHTCGLRDDATVACWGDDTYGQSAPPADLGPVVDLASGRFHSCALQRDGGDPADGYFARCWGLNSWGQSSDAPAVRFLRVFVGEEFSCGLKADARLSCWGRDREGQLDPNTQTAWVQP